MNFGGDETISPARRRLSYLSSFSHDPANDVGWQSEVLVCWYWCAASWLWCLTWLWCLPGPDAMNVLQRGRVGMPSLGQGRDWQTGLLLITPSSSRRSVTVSSSLRDLSARIPVTYVAAERARPAAIRAPRAENFEALALVEAVAKGHIYTCLERCHA